MNKDDVRTLSLAGQHERRCQVIRAHQRGRSKTEIAMEVGLSHTAVTRVIARYEAEGMAALAPRKRGRRDGEDRALMAEQEAESGRIICDKRPEQLKMDFALWSRAAVIQLIADKFDIRLHVRSLGKSCALGLHAAKADPARL
jgi:transposase